MCVCWQRLLWQPPGVASRREGAPWRQQEHRPGGARWGETSMAAAAGKGQQAAVARLILSLLQLKAQRCHLLVGRRLRLLLRSCQLVHGRLARLQLCVVGGRGGRWGAVG